MVAQRPMARDGMAAVVRVPVYLLRAARMARVRLRRHWGQERTNRFLVGAVGHERLNFYGFGVLDRLGISGAPKEELQRRDLRSRRVPQSTTEQRALRWLRPPHFFSSRRKNHDAVFLGSNFPNEKCDWLRFAVLSGWMAQRGAAAGRGDCGRSGLLQPSRPAP
jgi:hypothetical protein